MKPGTRIEIRGTNIDGTAAWYPAKIGRIRKEYLPIPAGYHPVTYPDGGKLLVHENRFRITDNSAA